MPENTSDIRWSEGTGRALPGVLLVDDRESNLKLLGAILQGLDLHLVTATSGEEAMEACRIQEFAAILLDVRMPGMDGFETARVIRQHHASRQTPIIFVTASGGDERRVFEGYTAGPVDYIQKPVAPAILRAKVSVFNELFKTNAALRQQTLDLSESNRALEKQLAEIQRLNRDLQAAYSELESFSYSVSHDLRTPVNAIYNFSQFLQEDYSAVLDDQGRDYLNRVQASAQHMERLIDDLMNLSRVVRSSIRFTDVDLTQMAKEVARDLAAGAPERKVEVNIAKGMRVRADVILLKAVVENLLGNAWKYSGQQASPSIEVGMFARAEETVFFVKDNGIGLDTSDARRLFVPFVRLPGARAFEGTGIGLATVARILHRHGGRVWAEGENGKGAVFYFTVGGGA